MNTMNMKENSMNALIRMVSILVLAACVCFLVAACTPAASTTIPDPCGSGGGGGGLKAAHSPVSPPLTQEALRESRDTFAQRMEKQ